MPHTSKSSGTAKCSPLAIDCSPLASDAVGMDVIYEPAALVGLKAMPKADAKRMMDAIQQVASQHPQRMGYVTELQEQTGYWRARKGMWRAVYCQTETAIVVVGVNKRGEVYR